ncbi:hypothetical protein L798_00734 [Zootermopsis nevadensis]|uniref:Uncharacterized protein n=1 Tax=Zootermopsis nevadensis TaxID=136037 RepID=A0A067RQC3_ZOONE|nr:hypothetical protein L798_00734 [Zootermopsis nevadensis]
MFSKAFPQEKVTPCSDVPISKTLSQFPTCENQLPHPAVTLGSAPIRRQAQSKVLLQTATNLRLQRRAPWQGDCGIHICPLEFPELFFDGCYKRYRWIRRRKLAIREYERSVDGYFYGTWQLWTVKGASTEGSGQSSRSPRMWRRSAGSPSPTGSGLAGRRGGRTTGARRPWPRNGFRRTQRRLAHWPAGTRARQIQSHVSNIILECQRT